MHKAHLVPHIIALLPKLYFETRKDAAATFNALVRFPLDPDGHLMFVDLLAQRTELLTTILTGSELAGGEMRRGQHNALFATLFRFETSLLLPVA